MPVKLSKIKPNVLWALSWTGTASVVALSSSAIAFLASDGSPFAGSGPALASLSFLDTAIIYAGLVVATTPILAALREKLTSPAWSVLCGVLIATICYSLIFAFLDRDFGFDDFCVVLLYIGSAGGLLGWIVWRQARTDSRH